MVRSCRKALLLVSCLTGALLLGACRGGGGATETAEQDIPFPETTPFTAEETARLHEIRDGVARIRGLAVNEDIGEGVVTEADLRAYTERAFAGLDAEARNQLRIYELVWRLMRMIEPDDDFEDALISANSDQVAGLYVPKEKRLAIVAGQKDGGKFEEFIMAHEYVHSFQDKVIDLVAYHEKEEEAENTERATTMSCVLEGDASVAAIQYMTDKYQGTSWTAELDSGDDEDEEDLPPALQRYSEFDYNQCLSFVLTIQLLQGWDGVNKLLENPPVSTEQILHPEKYIAGEAAQDVSLLSLDDVLGSGWSLLEGADYGEFDVYNYLLTAGVAEPQAQAGAKGWGGGKMQVYTQGGDQPKNVLVHIALQWDTPADLNEYRQHLGWAIDHLGYEAVSRKSADGSWTWSSKKEYGYANWSDPSKRVDILFANDQVALLKARDALRVAATAP
jgi:hypothetical protein